jgi:hypothetical protein
MAGKANQGGAVAPQGERAMLAADERLLRGVTQNARPIQVIQAVPTPPEPTPDADVAPKGGAFFVKGRGWVNAEGEPIKEHAGKGPHHDVHGPEREKIRAKREGRRDAGDAGDLSDSDEEIGDDIEKDVSGDLEAATSSVSDQSDVFNRPSAAIEPTKAELQAEAKAKASPSSATQPPPSAGLQSPPK